jgi:C4-dicarboxylate-specific signal transduction histidine kinase
MLPAEKRLERKARLEEVKSKRSSVPVTLKDVTDPAVWCDEIEIEQVLVNLINNAIRRSERFIRKMGRGFSR